VESGSRDAGLHGFDLTAWRLLDTDNALVGCIKHEVVSAVSAPAGTDRAHRYLAVVFF